MRHVAMFSGGIASWATARRVAERHGADDLVLLFADTRMEDEDLYRFLHKAAANVGGRLEIIADGRDPWQVFFDVRMLGNSRVDPCSRILKRDLIRRWVEANCDPADTTIYLGMDWTEGHRYERAVRAWRPWRVEAPLMEPPYLTRDEIMAWLRREGIEPPRLYRLGFSHNARALPVPRAPGAGIAGVSRPRRVYPAGPFWRPDAADDFARISGAP